MHRLCREFAIKSLILNGSYPLPTFVIVSWGLRWNFFYLELKIKLLIVLCQLSVLILLPWREFLSIKLAFIEGFAWIACIIGFLLKSLFSWCYKLDSWFLFDVEFGLNLDLWARFFDFRNLRFVKYFNTHFQLIHLGLPYILIWVWILAWLYLIGDFKVVSYLELILLVIVYWLKT